jgi:hypothetical protein
MNTRTLSKNYAYLTPEERVPLLIAAMGRGDDLEVDRLLQTSKKETWTRGSHGGYAHAVLELTSLHREQLLDLAAVFHHAMVLIQMEARWRGESRKKLADAESDLFRKDARLVAHQFVAMVDGWQLFCQEMNFDGDALMRMGIGLETIYRTHRIACTYAFSEEDADAHVRACEGIEEESPSFLSSYRQFGAMCAVRKAKGLHKLLKHLIDAVHGKSAAFDS